MYLIDTNIFLEALLRQERAAEVESFFQSIDLDTIFMTDFSVYSIGIEMREVHLFPRFEDNLRAFVRGRSFKCFLNLTHRKNIANEQIKER